VDALSTAFSGTHLGDPQYGHDQGYGQYGSAYTYHSASGMGMGMSAGEAAVDQGQSHYGMPPSSHINPPKSSKGKNVASSSKPKKSSRDKAKSSSGYSGRHRADVSDAYEEGSPDPFYVRQETASSGAPQSFGYPQSDEPEAVDDTQTAWYASDPQTAAGNEDELQGMHMLGPIKCFTNMKP
jgi:hypothetical protein